MPPSTRVPRHDAVILAGGRATRLGGATKPLVEVAGRSLLQRALDAAAGADRIVVVGPVPVPPGVLSTVEDPPFSGPAAGLAAGLAVLAGSAEPTPPRAAQPSPAGPAPWTLVLAADVPRAASAVPVLLSVAADDPPADGVCFHDAQSHPQWMLAVYRSASLRAAVATVITTDLSMRRLLAPLTITTVPGDPSDIADCDTWQDVDAARAREGAAMGSTARKDRA
ncbi:MAG: NTP transferase domain-containing protein [Dermatophilaceae bacterium]